jgi:GTP cyclohydrolase II
MTRAICSSDNSECLPGDVLGSLKRDCGPQLHAAIEAIADHGWGILLYLQQEGSGVGQLDKLRAYSLQDRDFDTVDAIRASALLCCRRAGLQGRRSDAAPVGRG